MFKSGEEFSLIITDCLAEFLVHQKKTAEAQKLVGKFNYFSSLKNIEKQFSLKQVYLKMCVCFYLSYFSAKEIDSVAKNAKILATAVIFVG